MVPPMLTVQNMRTFERFVPFLICASGLAAASANCWAADPIYSNQPLFYVPFHAPPEAAGTELVLHVSGDRGQTWHPYQKQPAEAGRFSFQAGADGEFWFAVRESTQPDARPLSPELLVIIDRAAPTLDLQLHADGRGTISVEWQALDPALAANPVHLEFRVDRSRPWQTVPENRILESNGNRVAGRTQWQLPLASSQLFVRGVAADRAGNQTTIERELSLTADPADSTESAGNLTWPVQPPAGGAARSQRLAVRVVSTDRGVGRHFFADGDAGKFLERAHLDRQPATGGAGIATSRE